MVNNLFDALATSGLKATTLNVREIRKSGHAASIDTGSAAAADATNKHRRQPRTFKAFAVKLFSTIVRDAVGSKKRILSTKKSGPFFGFGGDLW